MNGSNKMGTSQSGEPTWNAGHMLDVHILDYLKKRNLPETAAAFQNECHISEKPRAIDVTSGFLYEWWSIFWDIYVARSNPSYSQYANTYAQAQKARPSPYQQQQLQQQQLQMQQQLIAQQLMQEKNLSAEQAARIAEQITLNRLRGNASVPGQSLQDQMSARVQGRALEQYMSLQGHGKSPLEASSRGVLASPPLESRASSAGADASQQRNLLAAVQAAQRAGIQANLCNESSLEGLLGGTHPNPPTASLWPHSSPALIQRDSLNPLASLPDGIPTELRQQAIQKLQQQQQQQLLAQQDRQQSLGQGRGLPGEGPLPHGGATGGNNSRQSSASMQRFPQSPTLAQTQQKQQQQQALQTQQQSLQQQQLTASQIMLLQQNFQAQQSKGCPIRGQGLLQGPQTAEAQKQLMLAQVLSSNGLLKQENGKFRQEIGVNPLQIENFIPSNGVPGQDSASALHFAQRQQLFAQLQQMQHQQQDRGRVPHLQSSSPQLQPGNPPLHLSNPQLQPPGGSLQDVTDVEGHLGADLGHNDKSPASSIVGGSSMHQNARAATPGPTSSQGGGQAGGRVTRRGAKPKPATVAAANKKRKHNNGSSNSESHGTPPDSSISKDSESNKGPSRPLSRSMPLGIPNNDWDMQSIQLNKLKGSLGSSMNAAAAALDDCPDPLHFDMNDDLSIEPHLLLNGDGDVHDPAFL